MVNSGKIEIVAKNYFHNDDYLSNLKSLLEKIYIDGFKKGVEKTEQTEQWIFCKDKEPPAIENVQIMVVDDCGDTPYTYSECGWKLGDNWVVNNDVLHDEVVAWKPMSKSLSVEQLKEMGYL